MSLVSKRSLAFWCLATSLVACGKTAPQRPPVAGCGKDTDCKGERICESGQCVRPKKGQAPSAMTKGKAPWARGGPGQRGTVPHPGPKRQPELAWEVDLGAVVFATPALAPGPGGVETAFVGDHAGRFVGVALSGPLRGKVVVDLRLGGRIWGSAATASGRLYVGDDSDHLYAIDAQKGEILWKLKLGNCESGRAPGPEGARCDVDGGPTVGPDGELYVGADGLYRVSDPRTAAEEKGVIDWHWSGGKERPEHVFSTPLWADGRVFFGSQGGLVLAVDAASGEEIWRYAAGGAVDIDGSPVMGNDPAIYLGADDGRVLALRVDGSLKWSFLAQRDIRSSMSMGPEGNLYATAFDGNLYALGESGEVRWVLPTGGNIHSSPVVDALGTVFFGSQDDHLYAVSADGEVKWKVELPGDIDGSVALSSAGTLIVGSDDGRLRAYESPS